MKKQSVNPFLPSWEYIPDGEPRLFGDRVYLYGSHDRFNAPIFCVNDYVCWSAPADDLSNWRMEGVIYRKNQDPMNRHGLHLLFAPDVVLGADGRFYLYYAFDFLGVIGVAVSDTPDGEFQFYGHVKDKNGVIWERRKGDQMPFDPGVLVDEDGNVYLYSGFYQHIPAVLSGFRSLKNDGGVVVSLESDMLTMKEEPKLLFPKKGEGSFPEHEFFEASSIRKDGDRYLFVYSSRHNHELCYAVSDRPDGGFRFGGTLVSLGDLYLNGNTEEKEAVNYLGNTHGGMLKLKDSWYIFYHRQTNRHSYSRQACAEKLTVTEDGRFLQAEVTSMGPVGIPLRGKGTYPARIACNLYSGEGSGRYDGTSLWWKLRKHPYLTQKGKDREEKGNQYIANMHNGAVAGFKYFSIREGTTISLTFRGKAKGVWQAADNREFTDCVEIPIDNKGRKKESVSFVLPFAGECCPIFVRFLGKGKVDFLSFTLK